VVDMKLIKGKKEKLDGCYIIREIITLIAGKGSGFLPENNV